MKTRYLMAAALLWPTTAFAWGGTMGLTQDANAPCPAEWQCVRFGANASVSPTTPKSTPTPVPPFASETPTASSHPGLCINSDGDVVPCGTAKPAAVSTFAADDTPAPPIFPTSNATPTPCDPIGNPVYGSIPPGTYMSCTDSAARFRIGPSSICIPGVFDAYPATGPENPSTAQGSSRDMRLGKDTCAAR